MNSLEVRKILLQMTCASTPSVFRTASCIERGGIALSSEVLNDVSFLTSRSTLTSSALPHLIYFLSPFLKRAGLMCCSLVSLAMFLLSVLPI